MVSWIDGWLAILRPFQQYFSHIRTMLNDNERLCAREPQAGLDPGTARPVGRRLTHRATGAPMSS